MTEEELVERSEGFEGSVVGGESSTLRSFCQTKAEVAP